MTPTDREDNDPVTVRVRLADAAALTQAYRTYRAPLIRYARTFTGDADAAYDVVQDVFVRLWEQRETLTVEATLQALLYTMTRNRALNVTRHHRRVTVGLGFVEEPQSEDTTPDAALQSAELARRLRRWIEALPPRRSEAFVLSRFHGLSHAEIAEVMRLSVRTVDTHIVHALRDLRARLDALDAPHPSPSAP